VAVFPGSALFERREERKPPAEGRAAAKPKAARWLMASEIMETGRVYARTCARIDPHWAIELGAHIIRASHSEPFWNPDAGRVLVKERRRLYNLELETRSVGYGRINPRHATEIFLREGLVGDTITWPFDFLAHNRRLRERTETILTRTRSAGYLDLDEAAYRFYAARLLPGEKDPAPAAVASVPELVDLVRHRRMTEPKFLQMAEADLQPPAELAESAKHFPEQLPLANQVLPLSYAYRPGHEQDGVTLRVSPAEAAALTPAALDWAVPGHLREKIELLLKLLPKEQRRPLIPLADTAAKLAADLALAAARQPAPTLVQALAEALTARLGVHIDPRVFAEKPLPDHLRVRIEVVDRQGAVLGSSRELGELGQVLEAGRRAASRQAAGDDSGAWRAARAKWERPPAQEWNFGDLPPLVTVTEHAGVPVPAYPGLAAEASGVAVRLFATPEEAGQSTARGLARLIESTLRYELGWLEKDLRDLRALGALTVTLAPLEILQQHALECIRRWTCSRAVAPLQADTFARELAAAKAGLRGLVPRLTDRLKEILTLRLALQTHKTPYPGMDKDLAALLPPDFLRRTPYARLGHLPRYLRGMQARAERWKRDPGKDSSRARELQPFVQALQRLGVKAGDFRWLVEEFRVSLFAQELGTAEPVSAVRLERALQDLAAGRMPAPAPAAKAPVAALPVQGKRVFKSLDALGNLPR
jgi:ATP-dependent helicase HrpA